jgi:hypothetical protein
MDAIVKIRFVEPDSTPSTYITRRNLAQLAARRLSHGWFELTGNFELLLTLTRRILDADDCADVRWIAATTEKMRNGRAA